MKIQNRSFIIAASLVVFSLPVVSTLASTITDVQIDGAGNLTSLQVDAAATYTLGELIAVSDVTSYAAGNTSFLLVDAGGLTPTLGIRAVLIDGDANLYTGFLNIASANTSVTLEFATPIINQAGGDVVLFEWGGSGNFEVRKTDGASLVVSPVGFALASHDNQVIKSDDGTPRNLFGLEIFQATAAPAVTVGLKVNAVIFDLSDLGYADGASVSSISLGGSNSADLVAAFGLSVPEPASLTLMGAGLCLAGWRSRKSG